MTDYNDAAPPDPSTVEAFLGEVVEDMSGLTVTLMAALGDKLGLFKELATNGPATSDELSSRSGIHPRYAQEWLSTMMSARYLEYDPKVEQFALPPAHVRVLAEEEGPYFVGGTHQMLFGMLSVIGQLEKAFKSGEGIPMTAYDHDTWEGMERDMTGVYKAKLLDNWVPAIPEVQAMLERGVDVADVGCGSGRALTLLAEAYPNSHYVGYDVFQPVVERAKSNAELAGVADRVQFRTVDCSAGLPDKFDVIITFDVIHDVADPVGMLKAIRESLRPNGRYVCMEPASADLLQDNVGPLEALRYGFSLLYCMSTSLANNGAALGTLGLPETKMHDLCKEAGFENVRRVTQASDVQCVFEVSL